jgi:hypothetical protein
MRLSSPPRDYDFTYEDGETGTVYEIRYDSYTDPQCVVITAAYRKNNPVKLLPALRSRMEAAAMKDFRERSR